MKYYNLVLKTLIFIGAIAAFNSCANDSDFAYDAEAITSSTLEKALIASSLNASKLEEVENLNEAKMIVDTLSLEFGDSEFAVSQLKRVNLSFNFLNSFNQDFKVDFEFLDITDNVKYEVHFPISPGTFDEPTQVQTGVFIEEPEIESFKKASKLVYKITLPDGDRSFTSSSEGTIELQSKAIYFFDN